MIDREIHHRNILDAQHYLYVHMQHHHPMRLLSRGALVSRGAVASFWKALARIVVRLSQSKSKLLRYYRTHIYAPSALLCAIAFR